MDDISHRVGIERPWRVFLALERHERGPSHWWFAQVSCKGQYKEPTFINEILGAGHLGPVVCDVNKGRLFVGDVESGKIFEFDIKTHKSRTLAEGLSGPQGLLLSADAGLLYVADSSRRKIYVLNLLAQKITPRVFSTIPNFRTPTGIARLEDGRILVADDQAGSIFVLAANGTLQSTLHR